MDHLKALRAVFGARPKAKDAPSSSKAGIASAERAQQKYEHGYYRPGDTIGGRFCVKQVFEGGLGRVFVVSEGTEPFVLKTIQPGRANEQAFAAEARSWVRVGRHENIVPAFWVDRVAGMLCVAAEYIPPDEIGRGNIRDALRIGRPSSQQVMSWAAHFCFAMEHAVSRGIIAHRDIKPENLLLDRSGNLVVTDFGIAAATDLEWQKSDAQPQHHRVSGTAAYMAPEQWLAGDQRFSTDAYAFGVVLYELCFGCLPWSAQTPEAFRRAHLTAETEVPSHALAGIIERSLQKDAAVRFQSPQDLFFSLEAVAKTSGVSLPPRPAPMDEHREELFARAFLHQTGNVDHAFAAAQLLTEQWPTFGAGWTQLGLLHLEQGSLAEARQATERALEIDETRTAPWNNLGVIQNRSRQAVEAIGSFKKALACDPQNTGAMSNLSSVLHLQGQKQEAIKWLERALSIAPDKAIHWFNLGSLCRSIGNETGATDCFENALARTPESERGAMKDLIEGLQADEPAPEVVDLGALVRDGRFDVALPLLQGLVQRTPNDARIWHNLALTYGAKRMDSEARAAFVRLFELEPDNRFALRELMNLASRRGDLAEATHWCDQLARVPGGLPESKAHHARILSDQGDWAKARKLLSEAKRQHPQDTDLLVAFGDLAMKAGEPSLAAAEGYAPAIEIFKERGDRDLYLRIRGRYARALAAVEKKTRDDSAHSARKPAVRTDQAEHSNKPSTGLRSKPMRDARAEARRQELLASKPRREQFDNEEDFKESFGYWMSRQGQELGRMAHVAASQPPAEAAALSVYRHVGYREGKLVAEVVFEAIDDDAARKQAGGIATADYSELWCGSRLISNTYG